MTKYHSYLPHHDPKIGGGGVKSKSNHQSDSTETPKRNISLPTLICGTRHSCYSPKVNATLDISTPLPQEMKVSQRSEWTTFYLSSNKKSKTQEKFIYHKSELNTVWETLHLLFFQWRQHPCGNLITGKKARIPDYINQANCQLVNILSHFYGV